jgi:hypothetical protein
MTTPNLFALIADLPYTPSKFDRMAAAIIYLNFHGAMCLKADDYKTARNEIAKGCIHQQILQWLAIFHESEYEDIFGCDAEELSEARFDFAVPIYLLCKEIGVEATLQQLKEAATWSDRNREYREKTTFGLLVEWRIWLPSEQDPTKNDAYGAQVARKRQEASEEYRQKRDALYGERPDEFLVAPHGKAESFSLWENRLFLILEPKYCRDTRYVKVALQIGERCMAALPSAYQDAEELADALVAQTRDCEYPMSKKTALNTTTRHLRAAKGIKRYIRLLDTRGELSKAIEVCLACERYGIKDGTATGFAGRAWSLKKKLERSQQNNAPKRVGKVDDDQVRLIVERYKQASPEGRKAIAKEYGLTMSHLYYIVSKASTRADQ